MYKSSLMRIKTLLFTFLIVFAPQLWAQQSLFNVPSSEQTEKGEHFAQEQVNFIPHNLESNFTYDYGLTDHIEVGFNVLGWSDVPRSKGGKSIDTMANAQIFFDVAPQWHIGIGTQLGVSQEGDFADYFFLNVRREIFSEKSYVVLGVFDANSAYLEQGHAAWHMGIEIPIIEDKLNFIADYINGSTSISEAVVGFGVFMNEHLMLSAGSQFPSPQSNNDYGVVFELTYM